MKHPNKSLNTHMAAVTRTGLSPEFHFACFNIGSAGSFWRPPFLSGLVSQSVKSHLSKPRPSPTFDFTSLASLFIVAALGSSETARVVAYVSSRIASSAGLRPSKYSRTSTIAINEIKSELRLHPQHVCQISFS